MDLLALISINSVVTLLKLWVKRNLWRLTKLDRGEDQPFGLWPSAHHNNMRIMREIMTSV